MNILNANPAWSLKADTVERFSFFENAFSKEECERIIEIGKSFNLQKGSIFGSMVGVRDSNIVFLTPNQEMEWVYRRLTDIVTVMNDKFYQFDLWGFAEALQFTEYQAPGGKYDQHIDKTTNGPIRKLSIVVQLSDPSDYVGGDFEILDSPTPQPLTRERGACLMFPSYTLHRVTPVTEGTRHSLVGWISGKPFK